VWEGKALTQGEGETGLPHAPAPQGNGETGLPYPPTRWEGVALTQGEGETGLPHAPAPQGNGETGLPHPPTRWEGKALPGRTFFHPVGVRRSRMDIWGEHRPRAGGSGSARMTRGAPREEQ